MVVANANASNHIAAGHNADGLRARKIDSQYNSTYYLYDDGTPVVEYDSSGDVVACNSFGPDGLLSRNAGSSDEFYAFDPQGNTAERINASGTVDTSVETDAFGESQFSSPTTDPFRGFGAEWGYYADSETGLDLLGQRYYDPGLGSFLNRDQSDYDGLTRVETGHRGASSAGSWRERFTRV